MENNKKNFERFVALYIGETMEVTKSSFYPIREGNFIVIGSTWEYVRNPKLKLAVLLTPLSMISDEDAITVAKMHKFTTPNGDEIYAKVGRDMIFRTYGMFNLPIDPRMCLPLETGDFLRSKGYALPFLDTSVEDLISHGWLKLKA